MRYRQGFHPLLQAGVKLTCVDYSQEMLDVFREKYKDGGLELLCQDVCKLELHKQFDLVLIPFHSIAEITDRTQRMEAFRRINAHLRDGGTFFCTLYNPAYRRKSADGNLKCLGTFAVGDDRTLIVTCYNTYDAQKNRIYGTQFYEIYDAQNRVTDKRFLNISFSLITKDELLADCADAGFQLEAIYGDYQFGAYDADSMFMNFLFQKGMKR